MAILIMGGSLSQPLRGTTLGGHPTTTPLGASNITAILRGLGWDRGSVDFGSRDLWGPWSNQRVGSMQHGEGRILGVLEEDRRR